MKPLRTAILGCGGFAQKHAENMVKIPDQISLVAFSDTDLSHAATFAKKYGNSQTKIFSDHHELFNSIDLDLLVVVLPPFAHTDEVQLAAERGIHLLMEKPIALTSELAWQMVSDCEKSGIRTQVGFMYRFGAAVERIKLLTSFGQFGSIGLIRAGYFCNHLHAPWWRMKDKSGGQVFEQAIHLVDLMVYLGGEINSVYSLQRNIFHQKLLDYTVEDVSGSIFSFKKGGIGVLTANNGAIPWKWAWDFSITTDSFHVEFKDSSHARLTYTNIQQPTPDTVFPTETISIEQDDYFIELTDLLNSIETGGETRTPMREGARTLEIVIAAARSAESGEVVRFNS